MAALLLGGCKSSLFSGQATSSSIPTPAPVFDPNLFNIEVTDMTPASYPSRRLGSGYVFEVSNDSVFLDLPYTGEVYSPQYKFEVLTFCAPIINKQLKQAAKGRVEYRFECQREIFNYRFHITAYPNGQAQLSILTNAAQSIYFDGEWSLPEE